MIRDTSAINVDVTNENTISSSEPSNKAFLELSFHVLIKGNNSAIHKDNAIQQVKFLAFSIDILIMLS